MMRNDLTFLALATLLLSTGAGAQTVRNDRACDHMLVGIFNQGALRNYHGPADVEYRFDVQHANGLALKHVLNPPEGSKEKFRLVISNNTSTLYYKSGRALDTVLASNEIREMCTRDREDGFRLMGVTLRIPKYSVKSNFNS